MSSADLANATTRAFKTNSTTHWGPTIDGADTTDSSYNRSKQDNGTTMHVTTLRLRV